MGCGLTSSLSFQAVGTGSGILCPISSPAPSISRCSHPLFFTSHWISLVFLLYDRRICTHSIDPSLFADGEFPGLMLWSQRCTWSRNLGLDFGPGRGLNIGPRNLMTANVTTRLWRAPPFSRLLRHAGGYSGTILTPNLQGTNPAST